MNPAKKRMSKSELIAAVKDRDERIKFLEAAAKFAPVIPDVAFGVRPVHSETANWEF